MCVCVCVPIPFPVSMQDVMDLERKYWSLKSSPRFDLELFTSLVCPPVPKELVEGGRGGGRGRWDWRWQGEMGGVDVRVKV